MRKNINSNEKLLQLHFELDFAFIYQNFVEFKKICKTYLMKEFESKFSLKLYFITNFY
jgi:hypothetical protein